MKKKLLVALVIVLVAVFAFGSVGMAGSMTLPAGTMYYTMVEGAPGAAMSLSAPCTVEVIEPLNNGYTKIMMGTTTYLIKTSSYMAMPATTTTTTTTTTMDTTLKGHWVEPGGYKLMSSLMVQMIDSNGNATANYMTIPAGCWVEYVNSASGGVRLMMGGTTYCASTYAFGMAI